ncbi:MurR/RpiR family transcriptional regulator [Anaerosporobacter sp.]|uniref:MurR/RpiR family transcriptional regulator n=1 Tax=Anaerosporobacter sp. TaxID=1872529 RepID=UPI00286F050F|nr:MurR/RpiR family transcriptional regulator [Anaerosporobacter sp.]
MLETWNSNIMTNYQLLSKLEKKVADYILENDNQVAEMTLRQLAAECEVGQPTVVRMVHACGYESFKSFRRDIWIAISEREKRQLEIKTTNKKTSRHQMEIEVIQDDIQMILDMVKAIDREKLKEIVSLLKKANIIDIYGTDNSANAAGELSGKLLHLGLTCRNYTDLFFQKISAGHLGHKDVAIAFSIAGETKAVVDALVAAKSCGAKTIAVTGNLSSTAARVSDYVFYTPTICRNEVSKWISSRISQIAFIDLLCASILTSDPERFGKQLNKSTLGFQEDLIEKYRE